MKTLLFIILAPLFSFSFEQIIIEDKSEFYLCRFKSDNHIVEHYFKLNQKSLSILNCEYAIVVDDKILKKYKANSLGCENFIRIQINKGSVCINNIF